MIDDFSLSDADLESIVAEAQIEIDEAYWIFTRTRNGRPPCLAVPHAYARRNKAEAELRRRRSSRR